MKYLLWIGLFLAILWLLRRAPRGHRPPAPPHSRAPERMVSCAYCGLHLPESDGLHDSNGIYCCPEHREAASR